MSERIVFMGTPDFAVESLRAILENDIEVAAVVTAPDRPAGRGQKLSESAVKQFAKERGLRILQPVNLKDDEFIDILRSIDADLFVVVAFRMLPEIVWSMPPKGTINLHASLLPQYRGAAPINWAVINGETETGATTFFIEKEIDTGEIIDLVKVPIKEDDTAGTVHDRLMMAGAELLAYTVKNILKGEVNSKAQEEFDISNLKKAPKIFKPDCRIDWNRDTKTIYNKIRGLSPYPAAWTELEKDGTKRSLKLFFGEKEIDGKDHSGEISTVNNEVKFGTSDGWIIIKDLQLEGKKRMKTEEFIKGFNFEDWNLVN